MKISKVASLGLLAILSVILLNSFVDETALMTPENKKKSITFSPLSSFLQDWETIEDISGDDEYLDIVLDPLGNSYVVGSWFNSSSNSDDVLISKLDVNGNLIWQKTWGGTEDDHGYGISLDPSGYVYACGSTESFGKRSSDSVLLKYDLDGNRMWNESFGCAEQDIAWDVMVNNSNFILCAGMSDKHDSDGDVLLLHYDSTGHLLKNVTWGSSEMDCAYSLALDSQKNVLLAGVTGGFGANIFDSFLVRFNTTLGYNDSMTWGGTYPSEFRDILIDENDDIFICGSSQNWGAGSDDFTFLKLNETLEIQFNTTWGGTQSDKAHSLAKNSKGDLLIGGQTKSFGFSDGQNVIARFNSTGDFQSKKTWGRSQEDSVYSLTIDDSDYLHAVGFTENNDDDGYLVKFSSLPDEFSLSSNAGAPDADGAFVLSWEESLEADNYTLYHHEAPIIEINESHDVILDQITETSHSISGYSQGDHYFMVEASNEFGNTTSNCLKIRILFPPGSFNLGLNSTDQSEGILRLNWSSSARASHYSIYQSDEKMTDVEEATQLTNYTTSNTYTTSGLLNGRWFFTVQAHNDAGTRLAMQNVNFTISRSPFPFSLTHNAEEDDSDGAFTLTWEKSEFASEYAIYCSEHYYLTAINSTSDPLATGITFDFDREHYSFNLKNFTRGTYYVVVQAKNSEGTELSNCVVITVGFTEDINKGVKTEGFDWIFLIIMALIFGLSVSSGASLQYILSKTRVSRKWVYSGITGTCLLITGLYWYSPFTGVFTINDFYLQVGWIVEFITIGYGIIAYRSEIKTSLAKIPLFLRKTREVEH